MLTNAKQKMYAVDPMRSVQTFVVAIDALIKTVHQITSQTQHIKSKLDKRDLLSLSVING